MPKTPIFRRFFALQAAKPASGAGLAAPAPSGTLPRVVLETPLGDLTIEINTAAAPVTSANFLRYVEAGVYNGGQFHRTLTPFNQPDNTVRCGLIQGSVRKCSETFPPIPLERTTVTGLRHLNGVISMARAKPDSATSQFFICIGDQPELDFGGRRNPDGQGFAAFGRVVDGWLVLKKIQMAPADGQKLDPYVPITLARRL
jgi:peptidyl-prolyl cis-trans isomerase A (cyclophilin A)